MAGPYTWVPPTYWYGSPNTSNTSGVFGNAEGFATEISPGAVPLSQESLNRIIPHDL